MKYFLVALLMLLMTSCKKEYEFWNLSKFNIDDTALNDGEEIKLLYTSNGPDENLEQKYYIHLVVVSQRSKDTVNILTTSKNFLDGKSGSKTFNYYKENSLFSKITQSVLNGENIKHIDDLKNVDHKDITKVARDVKFDYIADNNFPTVIGMIGKTSSN